MHHEIAKYAEKAATHIHGWKRRVEKSVYRFKGRSDWRSWTRPENSQMDGFQVKGFCCLPDEIKAMVVDILTEEEERSALVRFSLTCQRLCRLTEPYLWRSITITLYGAPVQFNTHFLSFCRTMKKHPHLQAQIQLAKILWRPGFLHDALILNQLTAKVVGLLPAATDFIFCDRASGEVMKAWEIFSTDQVRQRIERVQVMCLRDSDFHSFYHFNAMLPRLNSLMIENPGGKLISGNFEEIDAGFQLVFPSGHQSLETLNLGSANLTFPDFRRLLLVRGGRVKWIQCGLPTDDEENAADDIVFPELMSTALDPAKHHLETLTVLDNQLRHHWIINAYESSFRLLQFTALTKLTAPIDVFAQPLDIEEVMLGVTRDLEYRVADALPPSLITLTLYFDLTSKEIDHIAQGPEWNFEVERQQRQRHKRHKIMPVLLSRRRNLWLGEIAVEKSTRLKNLATVTVKEILEQKQSTYDSLEWQKYAGIHSLFKDAAVTLNLESDVFDERFTWPANQRLARSRSHL